MTEAEVEEFYREGFILMPGLVPAGSVRAVMEAAPAEVADTGRWQPRVFDHDAPLRDAPRHRLLVEPSVMEAAERIFSAPPRVWYGMFAVVPSRGGHGLPWHQDNQYTRLLGPALNVFIALCDIRCEKAGLWIAPRSHLLGTVPAARNETTAPGHREATFEPENALPLPPMRPGDACIFHRETLHRSLRNETEEHRYAYAAQYLHEHTRLAETGKRDPRRMLAADLRRQWSEAGVL